MNKKFLFALMAIMLGVFAFAGQMTTYDPTPGESHISIPSDNEKEIKAIGFIVDITTPSATVINPVAFEPTVQILNVTTETLADVWIRLSVKDVLTGEVAYRDSVLVADSLASAADTELVFPAFTPLYLKQYMMYAEVFKDTFDGVDTLYFSTYDADATPTFAYDPTSPQNYLSDYTPSAEFTNNGTQTLTFYAHCDVFEGGLKVYSDSQLVSNLIPAGFTDVTFATFYAPHVPGTSTIYFYTNMKHDVDRTNDTLSYDITIDSPVVMWTTLDPTTSTSTQWAGRCVDSEGKLYVVGGLNTSALVNLVQTYDTLAGWTTLTTLPSPVFGPSCAVIDSKLVVIDGGNLSFAAVHATQIFDLRTMTWGTGTLSPVGLLGCGGNVVNDVMYILGGYPIGDFGDTLFCYSYDLAGDTVGGTPWKTHTFLTGAHGIIIGSFFYGEPGETEYAYITGDYQGYHDFFRFQPSADTVGGTPWTVLAPTPADVGGKGTSLVVSNGEVYVVAGDVSGSWGGPYSNKAYRYDSDDNLWYDIGANLNTGIDGSAVGMLGNTLYTHGGTIGSSAIIPAPFEKHNVETVEGDFYAPYIVSTKPYDRQVSVYLSQTVMVEFSEPIDTSLWVDAVVSPDPGLLLMAFNENLDSLFIFHDDFKYNQTYYVTFDIFYDTMGYRSVVKSVPYTIGFSTGLTGINPPNESAFKLGKMELIAKPNSSFDFMLYSSSNERISVEIYSLLGSKVADLSLDNPKIGINKLSWNMKDSGGGKVSSGVYFFKINNSKEKLEGKIIVTK
ncbi:MAG: Ig-like domain-containing protein [bacterium]|nr:Ig-like domain-containing protein [bacterium]